MKKAFRIVKKILTAFFLILPLVLIFYTLGIRATGGTPTLFGYSLNVVVTPSMEDVLPVGSIILSREYKDGELVPGDIVTYDGKVGTYAGKLITHEVISVTEEDGETVIVTKGTNNNAEDPPISPEQIRSVLVCRVIRLGWLYQTISKPAGFLLICVIPIVGVILTESISFFIAYRKEKDSDEQNCENEKGKDQ